MQNADESKKRCPLRVSVRVRPFSAREIQTLPQNIIAMSGNTVTVTNPDTETRQISFDSCHWSHDGFLVNEDGVAVPGDPGSRFSGQEAVFRDIGLPLVEQAFDGYNTAVMAYGTTGSGKTHTMLGFRSDPGIIYLCCRHLFKEMNNNSQTKYKVTLSMLEVYQESIVDLLSKSPKALRIKENPSGIYVEDLTAVPVKTASQTEELLEQGMMSRTVAATKMNAQSSRSHLFITIHLKQFIIAADGRRIKRKSRIRLVDMAGSERSAKTGATGQQLKEGTMINKSISSLSNVIAALTSASTNEGKRVFVPYRDSKFTRLLKDELGGNCVTTVIATISSSAIYYSEIISTLRFAHRANQVMQTPVVNDLDVDAAIKTCREEITQLGTEAASAKAQDAEAEDQHAKTIESLKARLQKLELPWKETDSKEKGGSWWVTSVNLHQPELDNMPYLQNISEDVHLSGVIKHVIPKGQSLLGRSDTDKVNIELSGLGIQPWHAILVNSGSVLSIAPCSRLATVHVNGRPITTTTTLNHLDRLKLGACDIFIIIGFPSSRTPGNAGASKHTYEKCLTELAEQHPLSQQVQPSASGNIRAQTEALLLFQEFTDLLPQLAQARALAACFGKNMDFEVEVYPGEKQTKKLYVKVIDRQLSLEWIWSKEEFEKRKADMDELNDELLSMGKVPQLDQKSSPFYDADGTDIYLGRCTVSLHNLLFYLPVEDDIPVLDFSGKQVAMLHVKVMPYDSQGEPLKAAKTLQDPQEIVGTPLHLRLTVSSFCDVLWTATNSQRGVYCKVRIEGEKNAQTTDTMYGQVSGQFHIKQLHFPFDSVTKNLLDFLQTQGLPLELWGTQTLAYSPGKQPSQPANQPPQDSNITSKTNSSLMLDLGLAQDLRQFFTNATPVQRSLQSLRTQAEENSQAQEVRLQSWADCASRLQRAQSQLTSCVLTLKESVKDAIQRSKRS